MKNASIRRVSYDEKDLEDGGSCLRVPPICILRKMPAAKLPPDTKPMPVSQVTESRKAETVLPAQAVPEQVPSTEVPVHVEEANDGLTTMEMEMPVIPEPEAPKEPVIPEREERAVHTHTWIPVTEIVHHEAVTDEVKVVDQPATEGHYEGGTYPVVVCVCGAEFTSADAYYAHAHEGGIDAHGGFSDSYRSNQVWVEGSPEIAHYETRVLRDAWDEEVVTGAVCASCGAAQ